MAVLPEDNQMKKNTLRHLGFAALVSAAGASLMPSVCQPAFAFQQTVMQAVTTGTTSSSGSVVFQGGSASLTITGNAGQTLVGKTFNLYRLFDVQSSADKASILYTWNPEYQSAIQSVVGSRLNTAPASVSAADAVAYIQILREPGKEAVPGASSSQPLQSSNSAFRLFIEDLRTELRKNGQPDFQVKVSSTTAGNSVQVSGLPDGYYLIDEETQGIASGQAASLCMVTTLDPSAQVHIKSDLPTVDKEVQEKSQTAAPSSWGTTADFETGALVPFRYTAYVPNMNGYKTYQFIFHDQLNSALTFKPDSVSVALKAPNGMTKVLASSAYTVNTNPGGGDTFTIVFTDLKDLVDSFFNQKDQYGENTYGQQMIVTYKAQLNDGAADLTGKPLENRVQLEFSNNPKTGGEGQTGKTPWEETAVFTYQLDNLKVNNKDQNLQGAKFRLYYDSACSKEVILKAKTGGGYIVANPDTAGSVKSVEMVTGANGRFDIFGLDSGTYYLKETQAPAGYRLLDDPIQIVISSTMTSTPAPALSSLAGKAIASTTALGVSHTSTTDLTANLANGSLNNKVVNQIGDQLPSTGSQTAILLLGAGVVTVAAGGFIMRKKKQ